MQNSIELTVGFVQYTTTLKRIRQGLCSKYLFDVCERKNDSTIPFSIKKGTFPIINLEDNVILIATGTGIAPIRSFIWDRFYQYKTDPTLQENNKSIGQTVFFYGCRLKDKDYFYSEEIEHFSRDNCFNFKVIPAFSREQKHKIYVYQKMTENSDLINELVFEKRCHIILVGSSKTLPKYVDLTLIEILSKGSNKSENEIRNFLKSLKMKNIYYIESW